LNTLFASSIAGYLGTHGTGTLAQASAAVTGYSTAFGWAAGIFLVGAVLTAVILPGGAPAPAPETELAFAH
ncbi:MAG: hypothetical protein QOH15_2602, partial [Gaiellales bacterium]|nr:hypothetical protein [Gaiellales bacterium]